MLGEPCLAMKKKIEIKMPPKELFEKETPESIEHFIAITKILNKWAELTSDTESELSFDNVLPRYNQTYPKRMI